VEPAETRVLHDLLMDLVRVAGLLQPDRPEAGVPVSLSEAYAIHELDTSTAPTQQDLAERLRLDKSTVSRLIAGLEHKGLVARERDPGNRRSYRLRLTDRGRAVHAYLAEVFHRRHAHMLSAMTAAERRCLATGLAALLRALGVHRPPADHAHRDHTRRDHAHRDHGGDTAPTP